MRPRQVSDSEILSAARKCFVQQGPGVPTSVIANELGVSQPALFRRFGSKRELMLAALLPPHIPPWVAELNDGPDARSFAVQLREVGHRIVAFFNEISPRLSVLRASGIPPEEVMAQYEVPPPVMAVRALEAWLRRCHRRQLIRATQFEVAAVSILGALHYPTFFRHITGHPPSVAPDKVYIDTLVDMLTTGLALSTSSPTQAPTSESKPDAKEQRSIETTDAVPATTTGALP